MSTRWNPPEERKSFTLKTFSTPEEGQTNTEVVYCIVFEYWHSYKLSYLYKPRKLCLQVQYMQNHHTKVCESSLNEIPPRGMTL